MRILYVDECEVVSRNTAVGSKFSARIMFPCDASSAVDVLVRISIVVLVLAHESNAWINTRANQAIVSDQLLCLLLQS